MQCKTCHGDGHDLRFPVKLSNPAQFMPCPDCGGTGIAHCCDGLREQPPQTEPEKLTRAWATRVSLGLWRR